MLHPSSMRVCKGVVAIVEDDTGMRKALERMLTGAGFDPRTFGSAEEFLEAGDVAPGCLVADVRLPRLSGLELQQRLVESGRERPVIFITAHDSVAARREADRLDAIAFLIKPFEGRLLVGAVNTALAQGSKP